MKITAVLITMGIAVALQLALARYTVGGRWIFDIVLVGVVFAALNWGPVAGMLAGSAGGLAQDLLSNDVVGTGGLVKTIIGFVVGTLGAQFVVARPAGRVALLAAASVLHRVLLIGLIALIDQRWPPVSEGAILGETLLNSVCGLIAFQLGESLPNLASRRSSRRSGFRRREW
jgi:rod shape-determining protein MreD